MEPPWRYLGNSFNEYLWQRRSCTILGFGHCLCQFHGKRKRKMTAQRWTRAQLWEAGRCRQRFRPCRSLACNWPRRRSVRNARTRTVRQELRARRIGAPGRCRSGGDHLASGRIMMFASVVILLALPFCGASTLCFHGIDVRPVMPGATCYIASANDGAPCKRLGRVCKQKLGGPTTSKSLPKTLARIARRQPRLNSCQTSKFTEQVQLQLRRDFR